MIARGIAGILVILAGIFIAAFGFWIGYQSHDGGWGAGGAFVGIIFLGIGSALVSDTAGEKVVEAVKELVD